MTGKRAEILKIADVLLSSAFFRRFKKLNYPRRSHTNRGIDRAEDLEAVLHKVGCYLGVNGGELRELFFYDNNPSKTKSTNLVADRINRIVCPTHSRFVVS